MNAIVVVLSSVLTIAPTPQREATEEKVDTQPYQVQIRLLPTITMNSTAQDDSDSEDDWELPD